MMRECWVRLWAGRECAYGGRIQVCCIIAHVDKILYNMPPHISSFVSVSDCLSGKHSREGEGRNSLFKLTWPFCPVPLISNLHHATPQQLVS